MTTKPPKKSETLEIRLPHRVKTAFMAQCHDRGRTASEALRTFIEEEVGQAAAPARRVRANVWQAVGAAIAGLAIGAIAAPSLAAGVERPAITLPGVSRSVAASTATFERLDRNRDGVITLSEFQAR